MPLMHRMLNKGITFSALHRLERVEGDTAVLLNTFTRAERRVEGATVVLACGLVPNDQLERELRGKVATVHVIGDSLAPRRIMHATVEGARAGQEAI